MSRADGSLDALNFFLADVRDGLGPYLAIYLLTIQRWDAASIGLVMSIGGHRRDPCPDSGRQLHRRYPVQTCAVMAAIVVTACCLILPLAPGFLSVAIAQSVAGIAGSVFAPAIAAITLGMMGRRRSRDVQVATRRSIMQATRLPPSWPEGRRTSPARLAWWSSWPAIRRAFWLWRQSPPRGC